MRAVGSSIRRIRRCRTHLLADGEYSVMITAAGSGYSRWRDSRGDALARGSDAAIPMASSCSCGMSTTARSGRRVISPWAASPSATRSTPSRRIAREIPAQGRPDSHRHGNDRLARDERRSAPHLDHQHRAHHARNRAHVVCRGGAGQRGRGRRPPGVLQDVRADRVCRRRRDAARDAAHRASPASRRCGCFIAARSTARPSARCNSRPTGRGFSAGATTCATRYRSWTRSHCPIPPAPCSIRCCRCGGGYASRRARRCAWIFGPASRRAAQQALGCDEQAASDGGFRPRQPQSRPRASQAALDELDIARRRRCCFNARRPDPVCRCFAARAARDSWPSTARPGGLVAIRHLRRSARGAPAAGRCDRLERRALLRAHAVLASKQARGRSRDSERVRAGLALDRRCRPPRRRR